MNLRALGFVFDLTAYALAFHFWGVWALALVFACNVVSELKARHP